jgi:hypothetical protein
MKPSQKKDRKNFLGKENLDLMRFNTKTTLNMEMPKLKWFAMCHYKKSEIFVEEHQHLYFLYSPCD